jgi:hypothetical protein
MSGLPEMIAKICISIVVIGTIYSSFGLQWSRLVKRLYWIAGLILVYSIIGTIMDMYPLVVGRL